MEALGNANIIIVLVLGCLTSLIVAFGNFSKLKDEPLSHTICRGVILLYCIMSGLAFWTFVNLIYK